MKQTHTHHILPRHAGGTDDPENLIELNLAEHAEAHRTLYETHGRLGDKIAWLFLSGKTEEGESVRREMASLQMKARWLNNRETMLSYVTGPGHVWTDEQKSHLRGPRPSARHPKNDTSKMGRHERTSDTRELISRNRTGKGLGTQNAMSNPEHRAKVGASKLGRILHHGPSGERRLFIPGTAPTGYTCR